VKVVLSLTAFITAWFFVLSKLGINPNQGIYTYFSVSATGVQNDKIKTFVVDLFIKI